MRDMRALIRRLADEGITVLLSSHQLPEVQELCDRVAIVDSGRVVYEGALADLRRQGGAGYRLRTTDDARALALARAQPGHRARRRAASTASASRPRSATSASCRSRSARAGIGILALTPELATLEDLFFRLTEGAGARPARDGDARADAAPRAARRAAPAAVELG